MKQLIPQGKNCFTCGTENPIGLHLKYYFEDQKVYTEFVPQTPYGVSETDMNPGIAFAVLIEAMAWVPAIHQKCATVLVESNIRIHKPIPIGKKIRVEAQSIHVSGWLSEVQGEIKDEDGQVYIKTKGKFILRSMEHDTVSDHFVNFSDFSVFHDSVKQA